MISSLKVIDTFEKKINKKANTWCLHTSPKSQLKSTKLCELKSWLDMSDRLELVPYIWPLTTYKITEFLQRMFAESITIKSSHGEIVGFKMSSSFDFQYVNFLGIPYAKPPIGHLRFKVRQCLIDRQSISFIFHSGPRTTRSVDTTITCYSRNNGLSERCLHFTVRWFGRLSTHEYLHERCETENSPTGYGIFAWRCIYVWFEFKGSLQSRIFAEERRCSNCSQLSIGNFR